MTFDPIVPVLRDSGAARGRRFESVSGKFSVLVFTPL